MKRTARLLPILAVGIALPSLGQVTSPSPSGQEDSDFEELPELQASEILKPEFLKGRARQSSQSSGGCGKRIAADPIATIENAPKGNHEIHQSRGESIKALGKKQGSDAYEGNQLIVKATSCSTSVTSSPPAFLSANSSSVAGSTNVPVQRTRIQISRA